MKAMLKTMAGRTIRSLTHAASNGPHWARGAMAFAISQIDSRRHVETPAGRLCFHVDTPIERWRVDTLFTKEPETIAWLDRTMGPDSVIYDVGANIGLYTLYAVHRFPETAHAICFEPEPQNFAKLNRNIAANSLAGRITAFPVGLGAQTTFERMPLSVLESGGALHGERMVKPDAAAHVTGLSVWSLDELVARAAWMPAPTHLKIDVDGPELNILRGARATLAQPSLRHVLVELLTGERAEAESMLAEAGFKPSAEGKAVDDMMNVIFERPA
jgi:FkbM family methyltransferase